MSSTTETLKRCCGNGTGSQGPHTLEPSSANFSQNSARKDGLQDRCRVCSTEADASRRAYIRRPALWRPATIEQFDAKVSEPDASGCRAWLASFTPSGYANFQGVRAVRILLALRLGLEAIEGKDAAHLCQNSTCVEITHLAAMDTSPHRAMDTAYRNGEVSIEELIDGAWLQF